MIQTIADSTKLPLTGGTLTGALSGTTFIGTSFNSITGLSSTTPIVAGTAAVGTGTTAARADHVHGSDTTKASLSGATFTGAVTGTSFNSITNLSSTTPVMNGTAAVGTSTTVARADHVHASDTSRSPLAGSTSITTLGTITTGTWNGTAITDTYLSTISTSGKVSNSATTADSIWASSKKYW